MKISLQVAVTCRVVLEWGGSEILTVIQAGQAEGGGDPSVLLSPRHRWCLIPGHRTGIVPTLNRFMG